LSPSILARFGRGETIYDPWHYVPVLARKPGALRNGGGELKLYGMKAAYDEIMATAVKRQHEPQP
jgi:hypothetical protein